MSKFIFIFFLTVCNLSLFSQKETSIWYFGDNAGLDFNGNGPTPLTNSNMQTAEGCATISDINGDLLFYTNGEYVWNKEHDTMPNGKDLSGHFSASQAAIIVPKPTSDNIYYIFTMDFHHSDHSLIGGLSYSEVDMNMEAGLGDVTANKNVALLVPAVEKLTAVRHANGTDTWVVGHELGTNAFYTYAVTAAGVNQNPVISNIGFVQSANTKNLGCLKASPNGKFLAMVNGTDNNGLVCNFDNTSGVISNPTTIVFDNDPFAIPYGIEFSSSSNFLYISSTYRDSLFQYDITAADVLASRVAIKNGIKMATLQLGPDKKIYGTQTGQSTLGVINYPNLKGDACDFIPSAISLDNKITQYGLPNFITSFFDTIVPDSTASSDSLVIEEFFLPDAFTPNNDGINDLFLPKTTKTITEFNLLVFNRWGEKIYETTDILQGWDGKKNGKPIPIGTYVVKIEYTEGDKKEEKIQHVKVIW